MKCIIAGSQSITNEKLVIGMIMSCRWWRQITEVVSGDADGVDVIGCLWADAMGLPIAHYPVTKDEWRRLGKPAGPMRNRRMAAYADSLILLWTGASRGSRSMREEAMKAKLPVYNVRIVNDKLVEVLYE